MVKTLILNNRSIDLEDYEEKTENGRTMVSVHFKVTHEDYHDITTLLYNGPFNVEVPERNLTFKGSIASYASSVTNLYEKGSVGNFKLSLIEVQ
ncbi:DUF3219 family protein [Salipaludibacillus aurantiacus]|uniref:DUF3219 domain-containing protein n=1 Tax=Salipaludibacillus aurantiacus TaxID=1601833 RepID=A0A1H9VT78_9BACI|nr:DUF3219 family protein [Salipaludibacillus aurantiacus]SES24493.1 Protein of unknown function [Salipaludibacillus aurantiacus]